MTSTLVIVPCRHGKTCDSYPNAGPVDARDAYTGALFKVNREYAEKFGDRWAILTATDGPISLDFAIPGPYEVPLERKHDLPGNTAGTP